MYRQSKLACLVIFLSRKQPATLDILQNKLIIVQRQIQESCRIEEIFPCEKSKGKTKNVHSCLKTLILDAASFLGLPLKLSNQNYRDVKHGEFQAIRLCLSLVWQV